MSDSTGARGLLATIRGLGSTVSATIANRIELLLVELQLERARFIQILVLLLVALALAFLCLSLLTAALVVWLWDWHPLVVLLGLGLLYGAGAWQAARKAKELLALEAFSGSLEELKKDQTWLNQTLSRPSNSDGASSSPKAS